jgi:hypothetical protein
VCRTRSQAGVSSPLAMRNNVRIPGPWIPLSRSLMKVRSSPVLFSSSACEILSSFLIRLMTCPNAFSTPERG